MSSRYTYKPLTEPDAIRLIEIKPASGSAEIHCSLTHTTLSQCDNRDIFGNYTALSYVWGSPDKVKTIFVDGESLAITANLFSALIDLRDDTRSLWLWVDAICINQINYGEKAQQIQMMGGIYAGARHTIIYLGPREVESRETQCLASLAMAQKIDHGWNADVVESIARSEWFTRVWIFQELVFSIDPWVQCGRARVKWEVFCAALRSTHARANIVNSMKAARDEHLDQTEREVNPYDKSSWGKGLDRGA